MPRSGNSLIIRLKLARLPGVSTALAETMTACRIPNQATSPKAIARISGTLVAFTSTVCGLLWFIIRFVLTGFYVVQQNERAVKTSFGRAERFGQSTTLDDPEFFNSLNEDERERYNFPQLKVIRPGGPYFKLPWEKIYKVSVATNLVSIAFDPENPNVNDHNTVLEAVTKDQLNINLRGYFFCAIR